jgi:hypothetical protein
MKLVLDYKQQELRQKKLLPENVAKQSISQALQNNSKRRSANYIAKVNYNRKNNLDWQGKPKVK